MRLLIAEDDPKLLKSLVHIFETNHYVVDGADNGETAFDLASSGEYDGLVLDIMMPGMDGVTLLKKLRHRGINTPALFLTAKTEIYQRIEGLDAGADDYLPKPFATGELLARVRAMLRRKVITYYFTFFFAISTNEAKPAASLTAISANIFLFISMFATLRPYINLLYDKPFNLAAALIRAIHNCLN